MKHVDPILHIRNNAKNTLRSAVGWMILSIIQVALVVPVYIGGPWYFAAILAMWGLTVFVGSVALLYRWYSLRPYRFSVIVDHRHDEIRAYCEQNFRHWKEYDRFALQRGIDEHVFTFAHENDAMLMKLYL